MQKQNFVDLLQTEMDRKEFIKRVGVILVGVAGVSMIGKTTFDALSGKSRKKGSGGYGASAYGR